MLDRAVLPPDDTLLICFAHPAYRLRDEFERRGTGIRTMELRDRDALPAAVVGADVIVASGFWSDAILDRAPRLRFVQSASAGVNQFGQELFRAAGVRLASAQGANERAVAQHAMALILALARRLPEARDHQAARHWRPMQGDHALREDELTGRTLLVIGVGGIGGRLARLARAFDMRVIGVRRDPAAGSGGADSVHAMAELPKLLPEADYVALTCPLTAETRGLVDAAALARMKPDATLVNVARGACVVERDLVDALRSGRIGAAALDVTEEEPLSPASPLWAMPNVLITPHIAGETRSYERNLVDLLLDNLGRLRRGEALRNAVV